MRTLVAGLGLTLVATLMVTLVWGRSGIVAGIATGTLATVIQVWAVARLRQTLRGNTAEFFAGFGLGMLLRLAGVILVAVAIGLRPLLFPPLPTAVGFLAVLLPLLFAEGRFADDRSGR
jgi:hypothetical protein